MTGGRSYERQTRTSALDGASLTVVYQAGQMFNRHALEYGVLSIAPDIANAVLAASGVRITELPLLPERVYWVLRQKGG